MKNYSQILATLHDEAAPVGNLGRGTHYSVLRTTAWFDDCMLPMQKPRLHDFAVIWDEDHDERVITSIEELYKKNLFSPVLFIGERKGSLNVIISSELKKTVGEHAFQGYVDSVFKLAQDQEDPWPAYVSAFGESSAWQSIINSSCECVELYLKNIHMLWNIGLKDFQ
jgi:hypothetical protein